MKDLATLHAEQKTYFDKKTRELEFGLPELLISEALKYFLTKSTISQIDLMIEIVESKKKFNIEDISNYKGDVRATAYINGAVHTLSDLSTLLQAQRKLIEEQ